ncbi:helix-turn-helix domain-containing protein [Streptomyces sp. H39-S7]|uniref:AraC-like ligand-binding domain-containing protein n=1 Tax=Streptomyces sp. H39-S7 TaxID=3004357 RepID=UPI0022AF74E2|nr:helix-turn-helix domain-containing protein [Streptomyces sp. H39-S7]MCZ4125150.1 helix-turn-helix domain-containing protein [Streptomyces sp. H39-S7]
MWSTLDAAAVPANDRFEWFASTVSRALAPISISSAHAADFQAEAATLDLSAVQVSTFSYPPLRSRRTPALIKRSDPEQYMLALMTEGSMSIAQRRNHARLATGDMVLWDSTHPYEAAVGRGTDLVRVVIMHLPRRALPLPSDKVDRVLAQRLSSESGFGAILGQFIGTLGSYGPECEPSELSRLGNTALDLAAAGIARHADAYGDLPARARTQALLEQINTFIGHNLSDTELTPESVAARHHISVRQLHLLFEGQDESVAASIRRRRLERCHADLMRPELASRPIQSVAAHWGFGSAAVFSRAFRAAYGESPRVFRQQALRSRQFA